jgi:hypothetical protein
MLHVRLIGHGIPGTLAHVLTGGSGVERRRACSGWSPMQHRRRPACRRVPGTREGVTVSRFGEGARLACAKARTRPSQRGVHPARGLVGIVGSGESSARHARRCTSRIGQPKPTR